MNFARVAVPFAALALVAGCSAPTGGTAFDVAGSRTTMSQVDDAAAACAKLVEQDPTTIHDEIGRMLLAGGLADQLAKDSGVEVTPAMQGAALDKMQGRPLLEDPECGKAVTGFANYAAVTEKLGATKLAEGLARLDVQVNPAFGSWDASRGTFTGGSGSLSMQDLSQGKVLGAGA